MNIERKQMMEALTTFAEDGHAVVLGAPGVGKSHTLVRFAHDLLKTKRTCVFVPIDSIIVHSEDDLKAELGFRSADFADFLASQELCVSEKGILLLDAFDAARSEEARAVYLRVIRQVVTELSDTWTVLVSARIYDARKSLELMDFFPLQPHQGGSAFIEPSGEVRCRHFFIPELTDEEIREASEDVPGLWSLFEHGAPDLRNLLRVPFDIWLVERIASSGLDVADLSTVQSEAELLSVYWARRVQASARSEDLRLLLLRAARAMVESRSLTVRREVVYTPGLSEAWQELMSLEILLDVAPSGQRVAFGHNILFDYAVSVLLIEDTPADFERFVSADPSRPLFLRPSLNYLFTRLWHIKPATFWSIFWHILPSVRVHMRLFARLLPTAVVANELSHADELRPLLDHRSQNRELGDEAILRLLQALRALNIQRDEVWAPILHEISLDLSPSFVGELATCLSGSFDRAKNAKNADLQTHCGAIARNVLAWVWQQA